MAAETEIERLVVRLVGDDSSYRTMMDGAATSTGQLTRVSGEAEQAQEQMDSSLVQSTTSLDRFAMGGTGAYRSVNFLGMQTMRAGMLVSGFNAPLGQTVISLGSMTSAAGQTMRGMRALGATFASVSAMVAANPLAFAAGGAAVAGIATIAAAYKIARNEVEKAIDDSKKISERLRALQGDQTQRTLKGISQQPDNNLVQLEREAEQRTQLYLREQSELSSVAEKIKGIKESGTFDVLSIWEGIMDMPTLQRQYDEAAERTEDARRNMLLFKDAAEDARKSHEKLLQEQKKSHDEAVVRERDAINQSFIDQSRSALVAQGAVGRYNRELAVYLAAQAAIDKKGTPSQIGQAKGEAGRTYDLQQAEAIKQAHEKSLTNQIELAYATEGMLDPLNQELKIRNELQLAELRFSDAQHRTMTLQESADAEWEIRLKNKNRLLQEGVQIYEQFRDPLDKIIDDQKRLNQLWEAGGFKGDRKAFERAVANSYAEAHKLWQGQFQGQQFNAAVGGTSETTAALEKFRLGSTAVPKDMLEKDKGGSKDDKMVRGIDRVGNLVKDLVDIEKGKDKIELQPANF